MAAIERTGWRAKAGWTAALSVLLWGSVFPGARAQMQRELERLWHDLETNRRPPNDTEFIFARVHFNSLRGRGLERFHILEGWAHDYPDAEEHILQVSSEATGINLHKKSYVMVPLESEEIFKYPFLYFSEVGEMNLTEKEVENFRAFLNRGGFAMIDDFDGQASLDWFSSQMKLVFPGRDFVEMTIDHPLFHTFYELKTLDTQSPYPEPTPPQYYGYLDDHGRLCMIINFNNDIGDFWEWIDQPMYPLAPSTEALRFGVDYFLYALTH
jgi:hypothetical protein